MIEADDTSRKIDKDDYRRQFAGLQNELRELQQAIREAQLPVLVIFQEFPLAGRMDSVRKLTEALDPRGFLVHSSKHRTQEETLRHWLWRYWMRLPERGKIGFFERSWYSRVIEGRVARTTLPADLPAYFREINQTEAMLTADGALIVKFWLHVSKKEQRKRIREGAKDPYWKFTGERDLTAESEEQYEDYARASEEMLARTSTPLSPWITIDSEDRRARRLNVFATLAEHISAALARRPGTGAVSAPPPPRAVPAILDKIDFSRRLSQEAYEERKKSLQAELRKNHYECVSRGLSHVIVFEGWDAAGKGGTIRRLTAYFDPHYYDVIPVSKPTKEELDRHYLWRFWRHLPRAGHIVIYDRSWYGRVMVERIEGFCTEPEWRRAYQEINDFETQLDRANIGVVKFWLHISNEEQLIRFNERAADPHRQWKLTEEDWRNREKWDAYRDAVDSMVERTSTKHAPWHIVPANCKRSARVECMEIVLAAMQDSIKRHDAAKAKP